MKDSSRSFIKPNLKYQKQAQLQVLPIGERKMKKTVSTMILIMLIGILMLPFNIQQAKSSEPPATEWSRTYGGASEEIAWSIIQTSDGGYAIAGYTSSFGAGSVDFWLVKTDWTGDMQWNKTYGGTNIDGAKSVVQTNDDGYAIIGHTYSFGAGNGDSWLVKTDASGNMEWNRTYGGTGYDDAYSIVQTDDGGYTIAGFTESFGAGSWDAWLIKVDEYGNMEWNQTYGGTNRDPARHLVHTCDGGYAISGYTESFGAGISDAWLVKVDADGNMEWNQTYGGTNRDEAFPLVQTVDGGYALAGGTDSFGAGSRDIWLVRTDANGNMEWNKTYGGANFDFARSIVQTEDGGYVIAGETHSFGAGSRDAWLVKTDVSGNMEWNQTYGGTGRDEARSLLQTGDGGYALASITQSFGAGDWDFWLIKLAPTKISATVDIDPDTLNLKSNGEWITAYIELPEGYSVGDIDVFSILLNGTIPVDPAAPTQIGDYDGDGIPDLMVKFDRAAVITWLDAYDCDEDTGKSYEVTFTITGKVAETQFEGVDMVRVLSKG